ncbi:MAG: PQQ-binding-like beta-propeller repeat protein [Acidobacteriia bacterium]|nr:PQQ-binding-like beta-propeller repeat protein [Terriglobia bacterium]
MRRASSGRALWQLGPALLLAGACVLSAQNRNPPTTAQGEWTTYGGDLAGTKYSPLDQINKDNFSRLKIAWRAKSPDASLSMTLPGGAEWTAAPNEIFAELKRIDPKRWRDGAAPFTSNFKATPLMAGGVLYLNSPSSVGAALDAATGATRWVFNPKSYEAGTTTMTARWNQRGVAYWTDGKEERIYWGTGDGYLIAVDAKTGRLCEDFGKNGRVDLMDGLPRAKRGDRDFLNALTYSVQSPPLVVRDVVITPASISSYIITKEQIPGWLRAFDARTGKVKWTFRTIPRPGDYGLETWKDDSWAYAGKATVWSMMSADPELGYVYIPTNTTAPDFYGGHRHGNNLFAESILCLDVETGERIWHFQTVHHGLWDYDNPAAPNLLNITVDGRPVKALAQITKQGFLYAFDRVTGKPIWPIVERPVPASDIPGEEASPTQPFPTKPPAFEYQGAQLNDFVDFTPAIRAMAVEAVKGFKLGPLFTPPSLAGTIQRPSTGGGGNWGGAAVDPDTGILYVPSRNAWSTNALALPDQSLHGNLRYMEARGSAPPRMPQGLQLFKPPYTRMTAIDMNKGEHVWMTPTGNGDRLRNNPLLKPLNLPPLGGDGLTPGPLLTKTLLIYALSAGGSNNGPRLVAYDKSNGRELASADLPGVALGTPMTYRLGEKQYIALTVSGKPGELPEIIALTLP